MISYPLCSFFLTKKRIFAQLWSLKSANAFSGCSSPSFHDSFNICYVDRWRAVLYLHGFDFWGNHSQRQFEMVAPISCKHCFYGHILHHPIIDVNLCALLQRYLDVAGMKKTKAYVINGVVMFLAWMVYGPFIHIPNIPFSFCPWFNQNLLCYLICRLPEYCCLYTCFTMSTNTMTRYTATLQFSYLHS